MPELRNLLLREKNIAYLNVPVSEDFKAGYHVILQYTSLR